MKRMFGRILSLLFAFSISCLLISCSNPYTSNGLIYNAKYNEHGEIIEYSVRAEAEIGPYTVVPDEYNGYAVTTIEASAFYGCKNLVGVKISKNIKQIKSSAFSNCKNLQDISVDGKNPNYSSHDGVLFNKDNTTLLCYPQGKNDIEYTIPKSVNKLGEGAFSGNFYIKNVKGGENVAELNYDAFYSCTILTSIQLSNKISVIESGAFASCERLTDVVLPSNLQKIGSRAFASCYNLIRLTVPESVASIGENAFIDCYKLIEIFNLSELPIKVKSEDYGKIAFYALNVQTKDNIESHILRTNDGFIFFKSDNQNYVIGYDGIKKELTIPNDNHLTKYIIYDYAFYGNNTIETINIPHVVTSVNKYAFADCVGLKGVTFSNAITTIENSAFENCTDLKSIIIPSSVEVIGENAFRGCCGLKSVTIGYGVKNIGAMAFKNCSWLTINCRMESKPNGWDEKWNPDNRPVIWGYES